MGAHCKQNTRIFAMKRAPDRIAGLRSEGKSMWRASAASLIVLT
jgi:hypothetical protein